MKNPPQFNHPDRLGSPLFIPPTNNPGDANDDGGVHTNSGVNNKLCYLLTDGDIFNGQTVFGMGIDRVADLYYEVNTHILTSGADWTDLYNALVQAAINLGWSVRDRNNLYRACAAVEIAQPQNIYVDGASNCTLPFGVSGCTLVAPNVTVGPFTTVTDGVNAINPGGSLFIRAGSYNESIVIDKIMVIRAYDGAVIIGR